MALNDNPLSALETLVTVLEEESCFVPALVATGELMRCGGLCELARKCFVRALKVDPQQKIAIKGLVKACVEGLEVEEAVMTHFETIRKFKRHPDFAENDFLEEDYYDYKVELCRLLRLKKKYEEAVILCKDALEEDHRNKRAKNEFVMIARAFCKEN